MKPTESRHAPAWAAMLVLCLSYALGHFALLFVLSVFYAPAWLVSPLGAFVLLGESILRGTIDYRGQDSWQWPLILLNSTLYGLMLALRHCVLASRRRRAA